MNSSRVLVALVLALGLAASGASQSRFLEVTTVRVKPGTIGAFEEGVRKVVEAANKVGSTQEWAAFQVDRGQPGFTYSFATGFDNWGEMDSWQELPQLLTEAFGEEEMTRIMRSWAATFEGFETTVGRSLPELSTHAKSFDGVASHYRVIRTEIKPDMTTEYVRFLRKIKAAQEKAGDVTWIRRTSAVGVLSTYTAVRRFEKYADLDDGGPGLMQTLSDMYGEEEAEQILEDNQKCVVKREIYDIMHRPDLSRSATASTSN